MLNPGGFAQLIGPFTTQKFDTFTCVHCNSIVIVPPGKHPTDADIGGGCRLCMDPRHPLKGMICVKCVAKGTCRPFEKWLDRFEAKMRKQAAVAGYFKCS